MNDIKKYLLIPEEDYQLMRKICDFFNSKLRVAVLFNEKYWKQYNKITQKKYQVMEKPF